MSPAWTGYCTGCHRDGLEVGSCPTYHERVLCDRCAATSLGARRDSLPPSRDAEPREGLKRDTEGLVVAVDDATWERWEAQRAAAVRARPRSRNARQRIVDALELGAGYVGRDTVGAVCPLCRGPLAVTFPGELVELRCCDGCAEDDVSAAVVGEELA